MEDVRDARCWAQGNECYLAAVLEGDGGRRTCRVQKRLVAEEMSIDQIGISGRKLLSDNAVDRRFWAVRRAADSHGR